MATLASLPGETTTLLAIELETDSFFNLRLTNRDLCRKTFRHFLARYFTTRYQMLSRHSLRNLLQISTHPAFASSVRNLEICVDHLTSDIPANHPGTWDCPGDWESRCESGLKAIVNGQAYKCCLEDQKRLQACGLDIAYLTLALINLSDCKSVSISDTHQPWGARSRKRQTGVFPTSNMGHKDSVVFVRHTVQVVLSAVILSKIRLDYLGIYPGYNRYALRPELLPLQREISLSRPIPQLSLITYLFLMIDPENVEKPDSWLRDFLSFLELFPALKQFGLCFHPRDEVRRLRSLSTSLRLESLEFLSLAEADCSENDLASLFRNHEGTLDTIHLDMVDIIDGEGSWASLECIVRNELSVEKFVHLGHAHQKSA